MLVPIHVCPRRSFPRCFLARPLYYRYGAVPSVWRVCAIAGGRFLHYVLAPTAVLWYVSELPF